MNDPRDNAARTPSVMGILLVFILMTVGLAVNWGMFSPDGAGLPLVLAATALCMALHLRDPLSDDNAEALLTGLVIAFIALLCFLSAGRDQNKTEYSLIAAGFKMRKWRLDAWGSAIRYLGGLALVLSFAYLIPTRQQTRRFVFLSLVLIAISIRILMLLSTPVPQIDVFVSQTEGAKGLLEGKNVYAMAFPSPYVPGGTFDHYGYPPESLYANFISWHLFRDVRGLWVLGDLLGALFVYLLARRSRPGPDGARFRHAVTLAFLFLPRSLFVIEQSWTEPLCVATMGAFAIAMASGRGALAKGLTLGLWLSSKQYVVTAVTLVLKLRRVPAIAWGYAFLVGVALALPFMLWDFDAVYRAVFGFFLHSAPRPDALSVVGLLARFNIELPWWTVVPIWLLGIAFFTWRMPRNLAGWLFATAGLWLFFFVFGKQAFMNYFYLISFTLLLAIAATPQSATPSKDQRPISK